MQMALCHGPINAVHSIRFKDKVGWTGTVTNPGGGAGYMTFANNWGLFGGDDLEGGVGGQIEIGFGDPLQTLVGVNNDGTTDPAAYIPWMVTHPSAPTMGTHYRGLAVINFLDFYWGTNPYVGDVAVEVSRYWAGWYPSTRQIGVDSNAIHIIYESVINDQWGMGYPEDSLDQTSFIAAAARLYSESLGLSMTWSDQKSIEEFIDDILDQIDGTFFYDTALGKWKISLIRSDDPVFKAVGPSNIRMTSFSRRMIGETVNQLTAKWVNPTTEEYQSITVQDSAAIQSCNGQVIPGTKEYSGVRNEALCIRLAQRDLQALSATLATAEVTANRELWDVNPGHILELSWPAYGIVALRMRVTNVTHASSQRGDISLTLVEDVFGQVSGDFVSTNPPGWVDNRQDATPFDVLAPFEIPFWFVWQAMGGTAPSELVTFGAVLPVSANTGIRAAVLNAKATTPSGSSYSVVDTDNATPSAIIGSTLVPEFTTITSLVAGTLSGDSRIGLDSYAVLGDGDTAEIVRVTGPATGINITLERGLMDTHPRDWPTGTRIYFIGMENFPADMTVRSMAALVTYKVTMQTSTSATTLADVPETPVLLSGRQGRPYPVGNVRIEGDYWPVTVISDTGSLDVQWSTRNRMLQTGTNQIAWNAGSVPIEDGTTTLLILEQGGIVVASKEVTTVGTSLSLAGVAPGVSTLIVRTIRNDLDNYQDFEHTFTLTMTPPVGFGGQWGGEWGG